MTLAFDVEQARAFVACIGGGVQEFRCIHDTRKDLAAIPLRGTIDQCASALEHYNNAGYGIFAVINELDGTGGRDAINVRSARAQFIDKDGDAGWATYTALMGWECPPSFTVVTRPGRFHAYWILEPHNDLEKWSVLQRKLIQRWQSDPVVFDAPRVMRLPGSWNVKDAAAPCAVVMYPGNGKVYGSGALEWALAAVEASGPVGADVHALGDPTIAAPSLEWATYALNRVEPAQLGRGEWLKITAAFKGSAWAAGEPVVRMIWDAWCAKYPKNDPAENDKLWRSIRDTKTGWNFLQRTAGIVAQVAFGMDGPKMTAGPAGVAGVAGDGAPQPVMQGGSGMLTPQEQIDWFAGCVLIESHGRILTPSGRFYDSTKFNAAYGGKVFLISADGSKSTDEPWKAATRGQVFSIPKVDHIRFLPALAPGTIVRDELGREGINTYRPAVVEQCEGDASPFVNHLRAILPTEGDLRILLNYLAHCKQRPGVKVFWAPLIQSAEGAGKGIILEAMQHALGSVYVYSVNAKELGEGGGKFNSWMRNKLMIIANEIRVDDRRDMMEVLKPMITENRIEIQAKGADQDMEDNNANWLMFTNWKDAIPITRDSRRYSIFYSTIQSALDLQLRGMSGDYFPRLYAWLRGEGKKHVAWFLDTFPIEAEFDPMGAAHRAPVTSSTAEAIVNSLGRVEQAIAEAIESNLPGFKGGWLSSHAVGKVLREEGLKVGPHALKRAFEGMGYSFIGRAGRQYWQEDNRQPNLYHRDPRSLVSEYGPAQGYGN